MTCGRTQEFLAKNKVDTVEVVDAKKAPLGKKEALELARKSDELYATKGKKVFHFNLKKDKPDDATLLNVLIGPSGNLRAPAFTVGKTLIVGFDQEMYQKLLK